MRRIFIGLCGLAAFGALAAGLYAVGKYGPVGGFYAVHYQLGEIVKKVIHFNSAIAGASKAPLTSIPFEYVEIDEATAGDCKMVGDIDGDGYMDLVIGGMPPEGLNWYRYPNWEKTFIATPNNEFTTDGALGDVDGDGDLDILLPDGDAGDNLLWFENPLPEGDPSAGDLWVRHVIGPVGGWGKDVIPADFDEDGRLDVATRSESAAMIFFQSNPGTWSQSVFEGVNTGHEGLAKGDVDGDGDSDLILQGVWLRNPGGASARTTASWTEHTIGDANPDFKALVVDLNQDGKMDVLFSSSENTADVEWWTPTGSDPTGGWTRHTILPAVEKAHTLQSADIDLDGDLDVVIGQMHTSVAQEIFIMSNLDGQATAWEKQSIATGGIHNGVVADIGNDGDYDLYGANWTGNPPVKLWLNRMEATGKWTYKQVTDAHLQTFGLAFGDVNGDGLEDILSGRYWYRNPGGDMAGDWNQAPLPEDMHAALFVDVDGDGLVDAMAQKDETEIALYWLEASDSTGSNWNAVKIGSLPQASHTLGAQGYRVAQVEAGGKPEILFSSGDGIFYFRIPNEPEAGNWPRIHINANPSDEGFAAGDLDGDGELDIAATTGDSKRVEWYRNPGNGSPDWPAFHIGSFAEALYPDRTEVADLNGDGKLDIIVTEENGGDSEAETYWWEQPPDPTAGDWARHLIVSQATTNSLDVGDIDGDGDTDVVLAEHRGGKNLSLWFNDGLGSFTGFTISSGIESHLGARLADLDGDNDLDITSIAWDDFGKIHLWRNDTGGSPSTPENSTYLPSILSDEGSSELSGNPASLQTNSCGREK